VQDHLVPGLLERLEGELRLGALDLLKCDDIDVFSHHPIQDAALAAADGVHVVRGDAHDSKVPAASDARPRSRGPLP